MNENRPDDHRMYFLLERMHSSSDAYLSALAFLADEETANTPDLLQEASNLKETSGRFLADAVQEYLSEIRARRHETGNVRYPFAPPETATREANG